MRRIAQAPISLERPIGEEDDSELGDLIEDEGSVSPLDQTIDNMRRESLARALGALPARERGVISMRYGLDGEDPKTLEEVGRAFGVTRGIARSRRTRCESSRPCPRPSGCAGPTSLGAVARRGTPPAHSGALRLVRRHPGGCPSG